MSRLTASCPPTARRPSIARRVAAACVSAFAVWAPLAAQGQEPGAPLDWSLVPPAAAPVATLADTTALTQPTVNALPLSQSLTQPTANAVHLSQSLIADPAVAPASYYNGGDSPYAYSGYGGGSQPINWTAGPYLKSGVSLVMGEGMLEDDHEAGYQISGGFRQPLASDIAGDNVFFDAGGSYMSAFGRTVRNTPGTVTITGTTTVIGTRADAFESTLHELQRTTVHTALGYYWGSPLDVRGDWGFRFVTRFGGRVGNVRGKFDEERINEDEDIAGTTVSLNHPSRDLSGGLFVDAEAIFLQRTSSWGTTQWTIDGEFANDWIDFFGFKHGSLGTASMLFGVMFSR